MSLDNLRLPSFIIQDLFQSCLVDLTLDILAKSGVKKGEINFFGGNNQHITVVVNTVNGEFISPEQLNFLSGIITACKLTLEDIAIVNIAAHSSLSYQKIITALAPKIVLLFGVSPETIQLPFVIPEFQKQVYASCLYLSAPDLNKLEENKDLKKQLWLILKQIFSL